MVSSILIGGDVKTAKWVGAALALYGVYDLLFATLPGAGYSALNLITGSGGAGTSYSITDLPTMKGTMFWVDLALIGGGAYLFTKGA